MEQDRLRIIRIEEELAARAKEGTDPDSTPPMRASTASPHASTSQYLQRQRQLLLEDYLRQHMSMPLQARSPGVLSGLEQIQRPGGGSLSAASEGAPPTKSHGELL